jgi:hypothetical protein
MYYIMNMQRFNDIKSESNHLISHSLVFQSKRATLWYGVHIFLFLVNISPHKKTILTIQTPKLITKSVSYLRLLTLTHTITTSLKQMSTDL